MTTTVSPEQSTAISPNRAMTPEELHIYRLQPLLDAGLTPDQLYRLDVINYEHEAAKNRVYREAINNDTVQVPKQSLRERRDQRVINSQPGVAGSYRPDDIGHKKRQAALVQADHAAMERTDERIISDLLPTFTLPSTGDPERDADARVELHDALMYAASMDRAEFRGEETADGNRTHGLYGELADKYVTDKAAGQPDFRTPLDQDPGAPLPERNPDLSSALHLAAEKDPAYQKASEKLDRLREELAVAAAKHFNRALGGKKKYDKAHDAYTEQMVAVGEIAQGAYRAEAGDSLTDSQRTTEVIAYILAEQKRLRERTQAKMEESKWSKFSEWLTHGSAGARLGKGALVGAGLTTVIGGAIVLTGGAAALGTLAGGGATALTVGKFGSALTKGYAKTAQDYSVTSYGSDKEKLALRKELENGSFRDGIYHTADKFDEERKRHRSKRQKALGVAALGAAAGVVAGHTLVDILSDTNLATSMRLDAPKWYSWDFNGPDITLDKPAVPDVEVGNADGGSLNLDTTTPDADGDVAGETPDGAEQPAAPEAPAAPEVVTDADAFFTGEGGDTHFSEAGVESFNTWIDGYVIQEGDTIWGLSEQYLRENGVENPTEHQIDSVEDHMLRDFQARGIADERGWIYAGDIIETK